MKEKFARFLVNEGYSETTPKGLPSTVHAYTYSIDRVCEWENTSWQGVAENIGSIVAQYDVGGVKEDYGNKSNKTVINALKRFQEFLS
jgi:hypothetical protein